MPRPGPRPYECVRRAWHSDRHQPMRGSIIQQIFRVVNEKHSPSTRKNREWQEKLPTVVFKAEKIMYSKANSEAEYMDPDTLWDRLNDAIDTIIRKEEGMETEGSLQPCIEAALVLGSHPVGASRSQRHSTPRTYLSHSRDHPPAQRALAASSNAINERLTSQPSVAPRNPLNIVRPPVGDHQNSISNLDSSFPQTNVHIAGRSNNTNCPVRPPSLECDILPSFPIDSSHLMKLGSVYPLYYGSTFQNLDSETQLQSAQQLNPSNVIVGTPVAWSSVQSNYYATTRDPSKRRVENALDQLREAGPAGAGEVASQVECDLTLRLGLSSHYSGG